MSEVGVIRKCLADGSLRLAYALEANAFAVLPLLIGIVAVGNSRFLSEAIDPTLHKEDRKTQIDGRVVEDPELGQVETADMFEHRALLSVLTAHRAVAMLGRRAAGLAASVMFVVVRFELGCHHTDVNRPAGEQQAT